MRNLSTGSEWTYQVIDDLAQFCRENCMTETATALQAAKEIMEIEVEDRDMFIHFGRIQ